MSRYTHDFQNQSGKRSREDNYENAYVHQQSHNYRFVPDMMHDTRHDTRLDTRHDTKHDTRHDTRHDMLHYPSQHHSYQQSHHSSQHLQHQPIYHDRINIYSIIKEIEDKHFIEVKRLKTDIHNIDDIIEDLKCSREKDAKYITELEQKLAKERILKEKYKNSEKNLMEKIVFLESSNSDMKSLLDKFSQQIPYSIQISPINKEKLEKEQSEQKQSEEKQSEQKQENSSD
jgi:hypothetical protein